MRPVRKITRKVKVARREEAINSAIRTGLDGGESFRNIANQVGMDFHIDKDKALGMVMKEYRVSVQTPVESPDGGSLREHSTGQAGA